jgi:3'-phosphoadenosine 5'-phosphosulfate sulfotransferase (PAPS reductase)/FAD synthetase
MSRAGNSRLKRRRPALLHDWEYGDYVEGGTLENRIDWDGLAEMEDHAKGLLTKWYEGPKSMCLGWSGGIDCLVILHMLYELGYQDVQLISGTNSERYQSHVEYCEKLPERYGFDVHFEMQQDYGIDWIAERPDTRIFPSDSGRDLIRNRCTRDTINRWLDEHEYDLFVCGHRNEHNITPHPIKTDEWQHAMQAAPIYNWDINHVIAYCDKYSLPVSPVYRNDKPTSGGTPWQKEAQEPRDWAWWLVRENTVRYGYTDFWKRIVDYFPQGEDAALHYANRENKEFPDIEDGYELGCDVHENPYPCGPET